MARHYTKEQKSEILRRILPPNNEDLDSLSEETGIPIETLRTWKYRPDKAGMAMDAPKKDTKKTKALSSADKFQIVLETANMTEIELGEYARKRGLYVEEIKAWRAACMNANGGVSETEQRLSKELRASEQARRQLEKDNVRKDKTIAEVTALLVLSKKAQAIWGATEEE